MRWSSLATEQMEERPEKPLYQTLKPGFEAQMADPRDAVPGLCFPEVAEWAGCV